MANQIRTVLLMLVVLSPTLLISGNGIQYGYDGLGRMNLVVYPDGKRVDFDYDAAGNMVRRSVTRPCFDVAVLNAALPEWNDTRDVRDLIQIVNCEAP